MAEEELERFERWLREHKRIGESSIQRYKWVIKRLLDEYGLERVNDFLIEYTQKRNSLWVRYAVKAYLQYKKMYDMLQQLPPPRHNPRKIQPRYLPNGVLEAIIRSIDNPKWRLAAWVQYLTGFRAREVLMLKGTDVFPEKDGVRIRVVAKGGREKFGWIVKPDTARALTRYAGRHEYIFHDPEHKPETTYRYYWDALKRAAEDVLGDREFRTHDFRRNFARDLLEAGYDVLTVKEMLGHRRVDTTMRYVGEINVRAKEIVKKVRG